MAQPFELAPNPSMIQDGSEVNGAAVEQREMERLALLAGGPHEHTAMRLYGDDGMESHCWCSACGAIKADNLPWRFPDGGIR